MAYRPKRFKRRPHHFRHRPRGFSGPFEGPLWRFLLSLLGVPRGQRRTTYNLIALAALFFVALMTGAVGLLKEGFGGAVSGLMLALAGGWFALISLRYFR